MEASFFSPPATSSSHRQPSLRLLRRISRRKLLALLHSEGLNFGDLRTALTKLKGVKVHVVGDTIVDSYTYCSLVGGTAKTPTFSVKHEREVDFPGGAAVVAKHLRQAGAEVVFFTVLATTR